MFVRPLIVAAGLMGIAVSLPLDVAKARGHGHASVARYAHGSHGRHVSARYAHRSYGHYGSSARYAHSSHGRHSSSARYAHASAGSRPARWCGWWMRTQKGGGPELNLAANWKHWGQPSGPRVGAVVVWSHHVGEITGRTASGEWIVRSGNDGGQVRERPRSVAGAVFRI
jgi:hypothetical protein